MKKSPPSSRRTYTRLEILPNGVNARGDVVWCAREVNAAGRTLRFADINAHFPEGRDSAYKHRPTDVPVRLAGRFEVYFYPDVSTAKAVVELTFCFWLDNRVTLTVAHAKAEEYVGMLLATPEEHRQQVLDGIVALAQH